MPALYVRLLADDATLTLDAFAQVLASALSAEGIAMARAPEVHTRGGFAVWLDCSADRAQLLIKQLVARGFRPVV